MKGKEMIITVSSNEVDYFDRVYHFQWTADERLPFSLQSLFFLPVFFELDLDEFFPVK